MGYVIIGYVTKKWVFYMLKDPFSQKDKLYVRQRWKVVIQWAVPRYLVLMLVTVRKQ